MKYVSVDLAAKGTLYRHPERCQAVSMCAAPRAALPFRLRDTYGQLRLVRYHICLDEVYDFRTESFRFDYPIGHYLFADEPRKWRAYWERTFPTDTSMKELMKSFSDCTEEMMVGIWRYERDVLDGLVSLEQYERAIEKTLAHYKEFCPNIRYVEFSNECYYWGISTEQYYSLFKVVMRVVSRLNARYNYEKPLLLGGNAIDSIINRPHLWWGFLKSYRDDPDPDKHLDFYTFHDYHTDHGPRIHEMIAIHRAFLTELGLPEKPMFFDEFGHICPARGDLSSNLENASGLISAMIAGLPYEDLEMFPWCSYHNPDSQMCYTQFIERGGSYIPTPNAHAMTLFSKIDGEVMPLDVLRESAPATENLLVVKNGGTVYILATNIRQQELSLSLKLCGLPAGTLSVTETWVDERENNCLTGDPQSISLQPTAVWRAKGGEDLVLDVKLKPHAFCLWEIKGEPSR